MGAGAGTTAEASAALVSQRRPAVSFSARCAIVPAASGASAAPGMSRSQLLNSKRSYSGFNAAMSGCAKARSVGRSDSSQSVLTVSSLRPCGSQSTVARRLSPTTPGISPACAMMLSSDPYCASHFAAVFGPTFGTPGTLSTVSPVSVSRSSTWSARTLNFASTPASSSVSLLIVFTHRMRAVTSCARSLSPVDITVSMPAAAACDASVPMTSSASTPSIISSGHPFARTSSCNGPIWATRSSGIGGRFALYSGYQLSRNVLPGASNTTAK